MTNTIISVTIVVSTTSFKLITGIIKAVRIKRHNEPNAIEKSAYFLYPAQRENDCPNENNETTVFRAARSTQEA